MTKGRGRWWLGLCACAWPWVQASAEPLRIDASAERMRVDGALLEWRGAHFAELGSGDDASLRYALASADQGLFLAAEVRDDELMAERDALVLALAMPASSAGASGLHASEFWLYPGESGKTKARALHAVGGAPARPEPRVQVVEGPRARGAGYVLEAFIPWAVLRGGELWEQGRGALRLRDADRRGAETWLASASAQRASELPRLVPGTGQRDLLGSFLHTMNLSGVEPRYDFRADVSGDAQPERVVIVDRYVVVYGPGYKGGETFGYLTLALGLGGGLKSAQLVDLTGDGRAELATTLRQQNELGARELWQVFSLAEAGLRELFAVELRRELAGGFIENSLALVASRPGHAARIDVKVGRVAGLDRSAYAEARASDAQPILLPWGEVEARSYAFDGTRIALVEEKRRPSAAPERSAASSQAERPGRASTRASAAPVQLTPASRGADSAAVLALFKRQQKLPDAAQPSHTLHADVLAGPAPERIDRFGATLVFSGPDLGGGGGFVAYGVAVAAPSDLLDLRAADLTGDGRAELMVQLRQSLAAGVERELLLVLRASAAGQIERALMVEVARRQGERAIENRIGVQRGALAIEPGAARGWSAASYPFAPEPVGGAEPLLLPWRDRPVRYLLEGAALRPARP